MPKSQPHAKYRRAVILGSALLALVIAGCGGSDANTVDTTTADTPPVTTQTEVATTSDTVQTPAPTDDAPDARTVTVYFMNEAATALVAEERSANATSTLRAALVSLADGPQGADGVRALPAGTEIIGTDVRGGAAHVNLNAAFIDGYPTGGSAAELAVLAPLVYTATEAAGVERVHVTVDGQTAAPAGSQFDWTGGFTRADFPDLTITGG